MSAPSTARLLPSVFLLAFAQILLLPILPGIKARWYTLDCNVIDDNCDPDFARAQKFSGIYDSVAAAVQFASIAALGKLSDVYGRKPILQACNALTALPALALLVSDGDSPTIFFVVYVVSGFGGGPGGYPAVAYISDVYEKRDRMRQFSLFFACSAFALVLTPIVSAGASYVLNDSPKQAERVFFMLSFGSSVLNALYLSVFVPESLKIRQRTNENDEDLESERRVTWSDMLPSFSLIYTSDALFYLCVVSFLSALPETGVVEIALAYADGVLGYKNHSATVFNGAVFAVFGLCPVFVQLVSLPFMKRKGSTDLPLLLWAQWANALHLASYALLSVVRRPVIMYLTEVLGSLFALAGPASNAILINSLSRRQRETQSGHFVGTLNSARSMCGVFGPLIFSQLYSYCAVTWNAPQTPFVFGACLAVCAVYVVGIPLRRLVSHHSDEMEDEREERIQQPLAEIVL